MDTIHFICIHVWWMYEREEEEKIKKFVHEMTLSARNEKSERNINK